MNLEALLDLDADPVAPTPMERFVQWVGNHGRVGDSPLWQRFYSWWLDRRCRSCGEERAWHADSLMGRCRAPRGS